LILASTIQNVVREEEKKFARHLAAIKKEEKLKKGKITKRKKFFI
jgi:hypothetical protein